MKSYFCESSNANGVATIVERPWTSGKWRLTPRPDGAQTVCLEDSFKVNDGNGTDSLVVFRHRHWCVAASKDRSVIGWVLLAAVFSFFALIVVAVLPSQKAPAIVAGGELATPETHVRCPDCKELVRADAVVCYHCHRSLTPSRPESVARSSRYAYDFGARLGKAFRRA